MIDRLAQSKVLDEIMDLLDQKIQGKYSKGPDLEIEIEGMPDGDDVDDPHGMIAKTGPGGVDGEEGVANVGAPLILEDRLPKKFMGYEEEKEPDGLDDEDFKSYIRGKY